VNFVYILECSDGTLYTGWTTDIERRLEEHNSGIGSKYTRGRYPVKLKYLEEFDAKEKAMSREFAIKKLSRAEKIALFNL
jgi:putative endonuclease